LFKDEVLASSTQKRWDELDVWYQEMDLKALFNRDPQLNPDLISRAYKTKDKSVNFRMLYQKLLSVAENYGVKTQLNAEVVPTREDQVDLIHKDGSVSPLHADIFIYTTGLAANETFNFLESTITARFWKSHSIIVPRLSLNGFFFVDPREVSIMPHGKYSIVCQSEDDFQIETPNFEVVPEMAEQVFESLLRLMPNVEEYRNAYHANACVKPDIIKGSDSPRSVDIELHEPTPNHFVVFPGKVTESPYMADRIVKTIFERKSDPRISLRPGDIIYPAYENKE
jgi:glycerol-3-phosphate dehydrogenase